MTTYREQYAEAALLTLTAFDVIRETEPEVYEVIAADRERVVDAFELATLLAFADDLPDEGDVRALIKGKHLEIVIGGAGHVNK